MLPGSGPALVSHCCTCGRGVSSARVTWGSKPMAAEGGSCVLTALARSDVSPQSWGVCGGAVVRAGPAVNFWWDAAQKSLTPCPFALLSCCRGRLLCCCCFTTCCQDVLGLLTQGSRSPVQLGTLGPYLDPSQTLGKERTPHTRPAKHQGLPYAVAGLPAAVLSCV